MRWLLPVAVAAALTLNACGDDDEQASAASTPASLSPTYASSTAPTTISNAPTDSQAYAIALVEAWERRDRDVVATLAGPKALETLFSREGGGAATWALEDCDGAMG